VKILEVLAPGIEATIQDQGRFGWRRFGVPSSGAMDRHAAMWANRLLNNAADAAVIELLYGGAKLKVLCDGWIAITGAASAANIPIWRAIKLSAGQTLSFGPHKHGMWSYVAVSGRFEASRFLGSASVYKRGKIGSALVAGDVLCCSATDFTLPYGISGRLVPPAEQRDYRQLPALRIWQGPQWELFDENARDALCETDWTISPQSDRVGYRLSGVPLKARTHQLLSEPVLEGSIQVPANGQPIVTMRDGPTVGGYPKIALIDPDDLSWLAQCEPGQKVRFRM